MKLLKNLDTMGILVNKKQPNQVVFFWFYFIIEVIDWKNIIWIKRDL